jgi:prophage regulatory protein
MPRTTPQDHPVTYTTDKALAAKWSVSRTTIWRWAAQGRIKKPVKLSPGCSRWELPCEINAEVK